MTELTLAAAAWVLLHLVIAGPARSGLVGRFGESAYRGLFSVLSAVALGWLIWSYGRAPHVELWGSIPALMAIPVIVMPVALVLLVGALRPTNPTLAGPDIFLKGPLPVVSLTKITRHPMLWAFSLWAASHLLANGDAATALLTGAILITALNGMRSIDRKRAIKFSKEWEGFVNKTSIIPFVAIAQGRQKASLADIGWVNIIVAAIGYGVLLWAHPALFGVPAIGL